ncbi:MAG: GNAT family N-acetyltransferase [Armatimonadetes bacterium]|nr:GNAT family N-acetyltransferase [Anaerolineae bacterium]
MSALTVTPYERRYRQTVLDLLYNSAQTHLHLDWYTPEQWLDGITTPLYLAWNHRRLLGALGISSPLGQTSWLRMVIVRDGTLPVPVLKMLWGGIQPDLSRLDVASVWILAANGWLLDYAGVLGFAPAEMVISLHRPSVAPPPLRPTELDIRAAELDDIPAMTTIDQQAFTPPWQLTQADIWQAARMAAVCTTAWQAGRMVGYQLSTRHRDGGHLARLAVLPEVQGQGVGGALLHRMIEAFRARRVYELTVNTQLSNLRSQRLYESYGFERNGYDLPVWTTAVL